MWIKLDYKRRNVQDSVTCIHRLVESTPHRFLTRGDLQKVGIRAERRYMSPGNYIAFNPCFFNPRPPDFASNPRTDSEKTKNSAVDNIGENEHQNTDTEAAERPGPRYPSILGRHHGDRLDKIVPGSFTMRTFTCLSDKGATTKGKWKEDPALGLLDVSSSNWRAAVCIEDPTYRHPHAIIDVMTDTDVVSVDLSAGEVKAIMRTMKTRMGISYYRDHVTLPLLMISYLGPDYGRIIHAHHDGSRMVVQHSSLFNLREPTNNHIELFLRYYCSEPARASQGLWFNK
ncbi:predicted protein [Aspergillus terreus NIH2624]|uniref:Uncharacterized protein n=1 Tax=Aspergillus terreus (strain NIH 2624 / FGSC A1156) TaxID=341663 RepID=Q0CJJ3_ASPTN|nr:uncharacterized protein ATEG_06141 [Aspergillus terreus NIH2624]EAU33902.1 predicted protein [Aspergillus terreus NIH2624]